MRSYSRHCLLYLLVLVLRNSKGASGLGRVLWDWNRHSARVPYSPTLLITVAAIKATTPFSFTPPIQISSLVFNPIIKAMNGSGEEEKTVGNLRELIIRRLKYVQAGQTEAAVVGW